VVGSQQAVELTHGLWEEDANELGEDPLTESDPGLAKLYQASVRGVLSLGPRAGERAVRFFGEAASEDPGVRRVSGGFNLHARQSIGAGDRAGLERSVGLPADSPELSPPREVGELFGLPRAA
jgi:hypothetical protein